MKPPMLLKGSFFLPDSLLYVGEGLNRSYFKINVPLHFLREQIFISKRL